MSKTGPSAFVVVGESDWWSSQYRHTDMRYDSRLLSTSLLTGIGAWRSILSAGTRVPTSVGWYAELVNEGGSENLMFGVADDAYKATVVSTWVADAANAASMRQNNAANIYLDAAINQTGLGGATAGDVMGLKLYLDSGTSKVQFYKNGVAFGTAVTVTSANFRLGASWTTADVSATLRVDRDSLQYLPSGAQPWGAAARVADVGGYSRAASRWTQNGTNVTVDAYGRLASSTLADDSAGAGNAPDYSAATGIYYYEAVIEAIGANRPIGGLAIRTHNHSTTTFIGQSATSWGYYAVDGNKYNNGVGAAYGTSATTGDRIGVFWQPSTGSVWWSKNGVVQNSGDPEAGTGAAYTNATGDLVPAYSPYTGRVRLCTHAREQLYRPSYATAWDGADILPEQHYRDAILGDTEITTGIWFPFPWGGSRRTGSPLGTLVLDNAGGYYDDLRGYDLRDEELVVYELVDDLPAYLARVRCDSITMDGEATVSINSMGLDCLMDVRLEAPAFSLGVCNGLVPLTPISATALIWNVSHTPYFTMDGLLDGGIAGTYGTTWVYAPNASAYGVRRLTSPYPNKHAADELATYRATTQVTVPNGDFSSWTGDNPNSWTVTESAGTAEIKQSGSAARFHRTSGSATCTMTCTIAPPAVAGGDHLFAVITVSAYTSGDILAGLGGGAPATVGVNGTGTFVVPLTGSPRTTLELKCSSSLTDLTVTQVDVWHCTRTDRLEQSYAYLLEDYAGLTSSQYEFKNVPSTYTTGVSAGYWTDQRPTVRQVIDQLNMSWACDYYTKPDGVLCFVVLSNPGDQSTTATLTELDAIGPIISIRDDQAPALTDRVWSDINFLRYNDNDLVAGVDTFTRSIYTAVGVENVIASAGIGNAYHDFYAHAVGATAFESIHDAASVTAVLANTVATWYEDRKVFVEREFKNDSVRDIDPGDYVSLTTNRYGLSAKKVALISKTRRLKSPVVRCVFWG